MTALTEMERACVLIMGHAGYSSSGTASAEEMMDDNMTFADITDFPFAPKIVRGVISSLIKKDMAVYFHRPDDTDLYCLTDDGIKSFWEMKEGA